MHLDKCDEAGIPWTRKGQIEEVKKSRLESELEEILPTGLHSEREFVLPSFEVEDYFLKAEFLELWREVKAATKAVKGEPGQLFVTFDYHWMITTGLLGKKRKMRMRNKQKTCTMCGVKFYPANEVCFLAPADSERGQWVGGNPIFGNGWQVG